MPKVVPEYKERAKERILEAGAKVFTDRGYYQSRMEDIAEALGVSKGAIYQYFKSKEQLFIEVIQFILETRKDEIVSILLSGNPMLISTGDFFEKRISESLQTRSLGLDLFIEAARNETLRARMTEVYERSYNEFIQHVENMKKQGVIRRDADLGVIWRGLVALRDGLISSMLLGADMSDAKKTWEYVATILLRGVLT